VDEQHSNPYEAWRRMGSPKEPDSKQYAQLESASQLSKLNVSEQIEIMKGVGKLAFELPRQGVLLIVVECR
jgi:xylan 1,4-beta-xylosidase